MDVHKFAWEKALRGADLTHTEAHVLWMLSTWASGDLTNAKCALETLCGAARVDVKTGRNALRSLERKGLVEVTTPGGGRGKPTVYALTLPPDGGAPDDQATPKKPSYWDRKRAAKGTDQRDPNREGKGTAQRDPIEAERVPISLRKGPNSAPERVPIPTPKRSQPLVPDQIDQEKKPGGTTRGAALANTDASPSVAPTHDPTPTTAPPDHRAAEESAQPSPPPRRCLSHIDTDTPPACGPCADARRAREAWNREHAQRQAEQAKQQHAADRAAASAVRAAAIGACRLCDADGYRGTQVCDHDPGTIDRARDGMARIRSVLAAKRTPDRTADPEHPGADSVDPGRSEPLSQPHPCPACGHPLGNAAADIHAECAP